VLLIMALGAAEFSPFIRMVHSTENSEESFTHLECVVI